MTDSELLTSDRTVTKYTIPIQNAETKPGFEQPKTDTQNRTVFTNIPSLPAELDLKQQQTTHYTQRMGSQTCTLVVLVGLPARGKTFIASRLTRYLNWIGLETRIFNVGTYRRQMSTDEDQTAEFFDPSNQLNNEKRDKFCEEAMKDLTKWMDELPGRIAVLDATNTTRKRRQRVLDAAKNQIKNDCNVFFIESVCDDPETIEKTVNECKVHGPDFANKTDKEAAAQDFIDRIEMYKKVYETIDDKFDELLSYIKIVNVGQRFLVNRIQDHIQSKIVYFLMNIKVGRGRQIYFTRHGESEFNVLGKIGGDSSLSENGQEYARQMGAFIHENVIDVQQEQGDGKSGFKIWVSELKRTQQTAACINHEIESWKILNEINAGVCEGMTYKEIGAAYPKIMEERDVDKYNYRYPMGESYYDLVQRLEPVIMELEKRDNVLLICHQAVLRCILAYFKNGPCDELPYQKCPLHTLMKLSPTPYGAEIKEIKFDIKSVDTHRSHPKEHTTDI